MCTVLAHDSIWESIDPLITILDVAPQVVHMLKYQAPVLALALSPDNSALIASTTDRVLTVRRRDMRQAMAPTEGGISIEGGVVEGEDGARRRTRAVRTGTLRYFNRGKTEQATEDSIQASFGVCSESLRYTHTLRVCNSSAFCNLCDRALACKTCEAHSTYLSHMYICSCVFSNPNCMCICVFVCTVICRGN